MSDAPAALKYTGPDQLEWRDIGNGWQEAVVRLVAGESAWNPASTRSSIYGPEDVRYRRSPSGGVTATLGLG